MSENTPAHPDAASDAGRIGSGPSLVPLPGSEKRSAVDPSLARSAAEPVGSIEATVVLRRRAALPANAATSRLTPAELAETMGAAPDDAAAVTATLTALGLTVLREDLASRRIRVAGSSSAMATAFGTTLSQVTSRTVGGVEVNHRNRAGALMIPMELAGIVTAVLGLDDRPQARPEFRIAQAHAVSASFTPLDLAQIYNFPNRADPPYSALDGGGSQGSPLDGTGQTIAIIELGGGFAQSELDTYFSDLGITGPAVTAVGVDGAQNRPGQDAAGADGEVLLDIEVAGALSPGAQIVVYFAPNTDAGFLDAVSEAAHADPTPTAMSISWGQNEDAWTAQARAAMDDAFIDAAALGVTVTVAAGDNGSSDGVGDGQDHADFPASSPHVVSCGGTTLEALNNAVRSETVWNNGVGRGATGGGVSRVFPLPVWQVNSGVPQPHGGGAGGRGVPDVAAVADPRTGYEVLVDGQKMVIGGTSAVAPLWAALIARLGQATGRSFGLINPALYGAAAPSFRDITLGNNGSFAAQAGWDACTGLGVPDGVALLKLLLAPPVDDVPV